MEEFENLVQYKKEEDKKDTINSEYIENNINDLHQVLNEKELNEKKLYDEINNMKLLLEKNKIETSEVINNKNQEILKIKEEQNSQMQTFQELINCLEQASNQIQIKDKKIEELLSIIQNYKNNQNLFLSEIAEDENENLYESINGNNNNKNSNNSNNISEEEKKFMKIQINQLKEIIEQDKIYMEE